MMETKNKFTALDIVSGFNKFIEAELKLFLSKQDIDVSDPERCKEELQRRGKWVQYQNVPGVKYPPGNQGFQWDQSDALMFYIDRLNWPAIEFVCRNSDGSESRSKLLPVEENAR